MALNLKKLAVKLEELENELIKDWGLDKISGGFVELKYESYDKKRNVAYLTCKSGVIEENGSDITEEEMTIDLKTYKLK